jgi:hypothetical protein
MMKNSYKNSRKIEKKMDSNLNRRSRALKQELGRLRAFSTGLRGLEVRRGSKSIEHNVDNVCTTTCSD